MDNRMKNHMRNLSNQIGTDVTNRYNYIFSSDDLEQSFYQQKRDLIYPLLKESKRDRYLVSNADGLSKAINELCAETLEEAIVELENVIAEDTAETIVDYLNSMVQLPNGTITLGRKSESRSTHFQWFMNSLTKGLVKGVTKIIEQTVKGE